MYYFMIAELKKSKKNERCLLSKSKHSSAIKLHRSLFLFCTLTLAFGISTHLPYLTLMVSLVYSTIHS